MGVFNRLFGGEARKAVARRDAWAEHVARVRSPQWERVEAVLGRPIPAMLRALYADPELTASSHLLIFDPARGAERANAWWVGQFSPADEEALGPKLESVPPGAFAFASNEYGDPYYIRLGELPDGDGPVFVHYHDGGNTEFVAPSLRTFLAWPREPAT